VVEYLKGRNFVANDLEGGSNVESDCEGDPTGVVPEIDDMKEREEEETRAILIMGSFSA
jgi:hypothetical protein